MTTPMIGRGARIRRALLAAGVLAGLAGSGAAAAAQGPAGLLFDRTLMREAGLRCHLFTPEVQAALSAGAAEARGATLRAGATQAAVQAVEARASLRAYAVPCTLPDLKLAASRVRTGFEGYARTPAMDFPGSLSAWRADRKPIPRMQSGRVVAGPRWRLRQGTGGFVVGLTDGPQLRAVIVGAGPPSIARLVLRDPAKTAEPYLDLRRGTLAGRMAPPSVTRTFLAQDLAPAPASLQPGGAAALIITFPAAGSDALAALDPREAAAIDLIYDTPQGERTRRLLFEVGDFAAGRAFLAAGR